MSVAAGELDYNDDEALNAGADYPDPWDRDMDKDSDRNADMNTDRNDDYKTEILLIETGDKDKDPSSSSSEDTEGDRYLPDGNSADGQDDEEEFLDNISTRPVLQPGG